MVVKGRSAFFISEGIMELRVILLLVLTLLGCAVKQPVLAEAEPRSSVFKRVHSSVVVIQTEHQQVVTGTKTQPVDLWGWGQES